VSLGEIPEEWKQFAFPSNLSIDIWFDDVCKRLNYWKNMDCNGSSVNSLKRIALGYFFHPRTLITISKFMASLRLQTSMERLKGVLKGSIFPEEEASALCLEGLFIDGAKLEVDRVPSRSGILTFLISDGIEPMELPASYLVWTKRDELRPKNCIEIPFYLYADRKNHLENLHVLSPDKSSRFHKRNVAILSSPLKP
jgi:hypothetical protein